MKYKYDAEVIKVIDGDTIRLKIDLGFRMFMVSNCRLYGINAAELNSTVEAEKFKAEAVKKYLNNILPVGKKVVIDSRELDKYGRPLIYLYYDNGNKAFINNLNLELAETGLVKVMI
jgi:micrococcal nuclease